MTPPNDHDPLCYNAEPPAVLPSPCICDRLRQARQEENQKSTADWYDPGQNPPYLVRLRDEFAAAIATGDAANSEGVWPNAVSDKVIFSRALLYYRIADAILRERADRIEMGEA